jgi:deferrochelatase/peroxidase EfeB
LKDLETCHIIVLMHITKNVFDNIIEILLDILRKTKDILKLRNDLVQFGLRPEVYPILRPNHYTTIEF